MMGDPETVIWHDLECGGYRADLPLWRALARRHGGPVLDVGAGTGRVSLALAREGHAVIALDHDPVLLAALTARATEAGLAVQMMLADARTFALEQTVPLCLVPMQTVQLLRGTGERAALLSRIRRVLAPGGRLALAIADALEPFDLDDGDPPPLPDVREIDGTVYASRPLAVRAEGDGFILERRREVVSPGGSLTAQDNSVRLESLDAETLEREAADAGFTVAARDVIPCTAEHVGSTVVMLDG